MTADTDDCDVTPSSLLDDNPVAHGNVTMNALVATDDTVLPLGSVTSTSLQTLAPSCGSQENQQAVTAGLQTSLGSCVFLSEVLYMLFHICLTNI